MTILPLLAAEIALRTTFRWGRIESNTDWVLPLLATALILLFVRAMYRRDSAELSPMLSWLLTGFRAVAFIGLLILYLQPQWRSQREVTRNSRAVLLVDTSSSMGLVDPDASTVPATTSRVAQVAEALEKSKLLPLLRNTHDVSVLRFDSDLHRIVSYDRIAPRTTTPAHRDDSNATDRPSRTDWRSALRPNGSETRLGEALRRLVADERTVPVSGIVIFSDGGQNAGATPESAVELAQEARIPIHTVGLGSDRPPSNVRVYKLEALDRAYPGDPFTVSGLIQSHGPNDVMAGKAITVQLLLRKADTPGKPGTGTIVSSKDVILGGHGETVPVKFELTPQETGRQTLCLRLVPPPGDQNLSDDFSETDVDVVDRKDRVLLLAGGPTREYGFLRTQLHRDPAMTVDVLLQTAQPGMSQEADKILADFPSTREDMFAYDCVIGFDPDWNALSETQIDLLESWVGEQGGGLILFAGPVFAGESVTGWTQDASMSEVRALYPVEFYRRSSVLDSRAEPANQPWPLEFTREGMEAEYLWLGDTEQESLRLWGEFPGVYSNHPVRGPKSAALVVARFGDPQAAAGGDQPAYMVEQFYGSGRVFYLGSGEMWRLRAVDPSLYERFFTQLIRHVSQGRLLRQSSRGVLLVGQDRNVLGSTVEIRAQLTNAQLAPLDVPSVTLEVFTPDGNVQTVALHADPSRAGTFAGQVTVLQEGAYRLELPVPQSNDERLTRRIQVALPDLERQDPQRNERLLKHIAEQTGGRYYATLATAVASGPQSLAGQLKDRTKTIILTANTDPRWEAQWMWWWMIAIAGLLSAEWLIRRLAKLA